MAPFIIDKSRNKLVVDLSNAFPVDIDNKPLELFFRILKEDDSVIILILVMKCHIEIGN